MSHHYKTPCKNCYRYQMCKKEGNNGELSNQRRENSKYAPFIPYNPESREAYRKWWNKNGQPIGMSNHDCYMTRNDFVQHLTSLKARRF